MRSSYSSAASYFLYYIAHCLLGTSRPKIIAPASKTRRPLFCRSLGRIPKKERNHLIGGIRVSCLAVCVQVTFVEYRAFHTRANDRRGCATRGHHEPLKTSSIASNADSLDHVNVACVMCGTISGAFLYSSAGNSINRFDVIQVPVGFYTAIASGSGTPREEKWRRRKRARRVLHS